MTKTNVQPTPSNSQHHDTPNNKTNREQTVLLSHTHYIIFLNLLDEYYGYCNKHITKRSIRQADSEKLFEGCVKKERSTLFLFCCSACRGAGNC